MNRLAIIGAGDLGKQALEIARLQKKYVPVGFFDDFNTDDSFQNLPPLGKIEDIEAAFSGKKFDYLFAAIGYKHLGFKQQLTERFSRIPFATIVHPTAVIEREAELESGVLLYAFAYIGFGVKVSKHSVINVYTYLPHDVLVKECSFLSCGVNVGGNVTIGERTFVGIGATVSDGVNICDDVLVGAGTVVIKDIVEPGTYAGCPARKIK